MIVRLHEDAAEARVLAGIDHRRLADRAQHALGSAGIVRRIVGAFPQIVLEGKLGLPPVVVQPRVKSKNAVIVESHVTPQLALTLDAPFQPAARGERRATENIRRNPHPGQIAARRPATDGRFSRRRPGRQSPHDRCRPCIVPRLPVASSMPSFCGESAELGDARQRPGIGPRASPVSCATLRDFGQHVVATSPIPLSIYWVSGNPNKNVG